MVTEYRSKAPFVVFGGMIGIGLIGLLAVLITHCQRDEPYLDPVEIRPGDPGRVVPRVSPPPQQPATPSR